MLRNAWIIAKKEIRLLFKSTRRIALLFSTGIIIILVGIFIAFIVFSTSTTLEGPVEVTVIQADDNYWGNYFYTLLRNNKDTKNFDFVNKTETDLDDLLERKNFSVLLYIPANFSELINQSLPAQFFLYYDNTNLKNEVAVTEINEIAALLNQQLIYLEYGGPINLIRVYSLPIGTSKGTGAILAFTLTMIPMYAIFMLVIPPLTLVLISVTIEREQKTLESLLLQPLNRRNIVAGKLLYGILLVAFNTVINLVSILILLLSIFIMAPQELKEVSIKLLEAMIENIGFTVWIFIIYLLAGLVLVSVLMVTAGVFFSLMAKDEREANMVISLLIIIPLFSIFFLAFLPIGTLPELLQLAIIAIPLLGYLFGVYFTILAGEITIWAWLSLVFQTLWIIVAVWLAGRLIESEGILEISFKRLILFRKKR